MSTLDDTAIFFAVVQQGGFSHAAKHLKLSNGLVSRRIAKLESNLGVSLIKRTTRQIHLTPEGEVLFEHASRIQQELDSALSLIQSSADKPSGHIRISAPPYFGSHYLTPIIRKFMCNFEDITIDLMLAEEQVDLIKEDYDLVIRGAGFMEDKQLSDSTMQMKLLHKEKVNVYSSSEYLIKHGDIKTIEELTNRDLIQLIVKPSKKEKWHYELDGEKQLFTFTPKFTTNDGNSALTMCGMGFGIGRFTELVARELVLAKKIIPILTQYNWGDHHFYAVYPQQKILPARTRAFLDFLSAHMKCL